MRGWDAAEGSITTDVLVVGGGAAGAMAALAAWAEGASVTLVRRAWGSTALSSGAIDLAPDPLQTPSRPLGGRTSLRESVASLASKLEGHPYSVLLEHLPLLSDALQFVEERVEGLRFANLDEANRCLATSLGSLKLSGGGLTSIFAGSLDATPGRVGVVGFRHHLEYDARLQATLLQDAFTSGGLPLEAVPVVCDLLDPEEGPLLRPSEIAREVRADPSRLARAVGAALPGGLDRLLFPPILGGHGALTALERELDLPCAELPGTRLSVPGIRLQGAFDASLEASDVRLLAGEVWADAPRDIGTLRMRSAAPRPPPKERFLPDAAVPANGVPSAPIRARGVIMATGKFIGGGVQKNGCLEEPTLRLPLRLGCSSSLRTTARGLDDEQALFRAGVGTDSLLRPLDERGAPVSPYLFACGDLLSGHDPARDGSGMGVSLFTGYLAGLFAARATRSH